MPVKLRFDQTEKILCITLKGPIDINDFRKTMEKLSVSSEFPADIDTLWDLREFDFKPVSSDFLRQIVDIQKQYPERSRAKICAIVNSDLAFGMTRMFEMLSGGSTRMAVFRDFDEGRKWLLNKQF